MRYYITDSGICRLASSDGSEIEYILALVLSSSLDGLEVRSVGPFRQEPEFMKKISGLADLARSEGWLTTERYKLSPMVLASATKEVGAPCLSDISCQ